MTSMYTTDSPETPDTFPLMVQAFAGSEIANTKIPITKKLRDMICSSLWKFVNRGGSSAPNSQYTNSRPATAELVRNGLVMAVLLPGRYTIWLCRISYLN